MLTIRRWFLVLILLAGIQCVLVLEVAIGRAVEGVDNANTAPEVSPKEDPDRLPRGAIAMLGTTRFRQFDPRECGVAYSPKGDSVAASSGNTVRRWDIATGLELPV